MSADRPSGDSVRFPDHEDVEDRLGPWQTFAGETPTATQLQSGAKDILDGDEKTTETMAMQSLRYVLRRQKLPHSREWKEAERACERVLEVSR